MKHEATCLHCRLDLRLSPGRRNRAYQSTSKQVLSCLTLRQISVFQLTRLHPLTIYKTHWVWPELAPNGLVVALNSTRNEDVSLVKQWQITLGSHELFLGFRVEHYATISPCHPTDLSFRATVGQNHSSVCSLQSWGPTVNKPNCYDCSQVTVERLHRIWNQTKLLRIQKSNRKLGEVYHRFFP